MNKYINKPDVTKTNFKMYKDGKHWVFAGLMLLSVPMALMGSLEVSAAAAEKEKKAVGATVGSPDEESETIKTASIESPKVDTTQHNKHQTQKLCLK